MPTSTTKQNKTIRYAIISHILFVSRNLNTNHSMNCPEILRKGPKRLKIVTVISTVFWGASVIRGWRFFDARRLLEEIWCFYSQVCLLPKNCRETLFLENGTFLSCNCFLTKNKTHISLQRYSGKVWLTLRSRMPHICGFLDCFSFSHLLATCCCF